MFVLDDRLLKDSYVLGRFSLSLLLLAKDANYPWCILVPEREDTFELYHLQEADQQQLTKESNHLAEVMNGIFNADKMNVAALGNMVKQLHIHHIVRFSQDAAWPQPIWGAVGAISYKSDALLERISKLKSALVGTDFTPFPEDYKYKPEGPSAQKIDC